MSTDEKLEAFPRLPSYPRAFIKTKKIQRESNRVFVAMPFREPHSDDLWGVVEAVCHILKLGPTRSDTSPMPGPLISEILEQLEKAEIIIADLTHLNANVLYEVGIAHVRCDSVVLLAPKGQELPFDLAHMYCIFYDLKSKEWRQELATKLSALLQRLKSEGTPTVIETSLQRTISIIADLQMLGDEDLKNETVWSSGFLSAFAISPDEETEDNEHQKKLLEEKKCLLNLACRGCLIRSIITPASENDVIPASISQAIQRTKHLLAFLESDEPALENIEWVVSPYRQKNFYIIGRLSFFEGFKEGTQKGFGLTLRQTGLDAINSTIQLHSILFERLRMYTLQTFPPSPPEMDPRIALRKAAVTALRKSLVYCNSIREQQKEALSAGRPPRWSKIVGKRQRAHARGHNRN